MLFRQPTHAWIVEQLAEQAGLPFSYSDVGASRNANAPAGYRVNHNRVYIGTGRNVFEDACTALKHWEMFRIPWVNLCWPETEVEPDAVVGVLAHYLRLWWFNACRVVYTFEETGAVERVGFAYGTLPLHAERGEERFTVEWHHTDDSVWYDLYAFSQPQQFLARNFQPLVRRAQRQFARDSLAAMIRIGGSPDAQ